MRSSARLLVIGVLGWVACGGASPPPRPAAPPPPPPKTLADVTDAMCACKDAPCADKVHADFAAVIGDATHDQEPHTAAQRTAIATCESTAREGEDYASMVRMKDAMCACHDTACVDQVQKDFDGYMKRMEAKYAGSHPDERMMAAGEAMAKCMTDAITASPRVGVDGSSSGAPSTAKRWVPGGPYHTGVPACDTYLTTFDQYLSCDKIPQAAIDAAHEGVAQMTEGWKMLADPNVPEEAKQAAAKACTEAVEALQQSASAMGCPMDPPAPVVAPAPPAKKPPHHHKH